MRRQNMAIVLIGRGTLLREGLARILSASGFRIVGSAPCVFDLVPRSPQEAHSILFIVDGADDLEAAIAEIKLLKEQYPAGRIAVVAGHGEPGDPTMLFRAGANVCVGNFATCDALIKTLELVMLDEVILPFTICPLVPVGDSARQSNGMACEPSAPASNGVARELNRQPRASVGFDSSHAPRLSARERCIVRCLAEGDSNKAIARKIAIAEATVKVHVKAILRKIRVQNRTQAAIWAINALGD
jgi:two-component system nitrate/nitrite response regulator NarL